MPNSNYFEVSWYGTHTVETGRSNNYCCRAVFAAYVHCRADRTADVGQIFPADPATVVAVLNIPVSSISAISSVPAEWQAAAAADHMRFADMSAAPAGAGRVDTYHDS